ncbi:MAG TPA: amidohydrolase, partial [Roseiarcus sp.]|nr:amidohydrolase [Roseiarcus sp.]
MCHVCEVAASGAGVGAGGVPGSTVSAPASPPAGAGKAQAAHGAAATAMPEGVGAKGRRTLIKGGVVLSMDERVGNHAAGDVLIDGSSIAEVAQSIHAPDAAVIDASGHIVMPGFIDAHHHQFETALRSFLADGILINDGRPESA